MPDYILPTSDNSPWIRKCLLWGTPLLIWAIIFVWIYVGRSTSPETESPADAPTHEQTPDAQPSNQPGAPTSTPTDTPAQTTPSRQTEKYKPYSFANAKSSALGLPFEARCGTAIIADADTREVLWVKDAKQSVAIASMTKMMTLLLAEEARALEPALTLDTPIKVTPAASKVGGSQVWLDTRETFTLGQLLKTIAIKSANDSAYLVGESLGGGDINRFVERMNLRAKELGMTNTTFYNPHGLEESKTKGNTSSAYDMILLGERLLVYPEIMKWSGTRMDYLTRKDLRNPGKTTKTELKNHNNLVFQRVTGVDGLKTGYTAKSGFCITISCLRGGRRIMACVTGFKSPKDRDAFCKALLDWAYEN